MCIGVYGIAEGLLGVMGKASSHSSTVYVVVYGVRAGQECQGDG